MNVGYSGRWGGWPAVGEKWAGRERSDGGEDAKIELVERLDISTLANQSADRGTLDFTKSSSCYALQSKLGARRFDRQRSLERQGRSC